MPCDRWAAGTACPPTFIRNDNDRCCVNRRFYACSPAGMARCAAATQCVAEKGLSGDFNAINACMQKLDLSLCTAKPERDGECR